MNFFGLFLINLARIIPPLLGIGIVIFIHELGHFIAARILKVDVECLSFGIGPKLYSFISKNNTEFRISIIPFGGYCRMHGSIDLTKALRENSDSMYVMEAGSYFASSPIKRFIIFSAGPLTNFFLAGLLFAIVAMIPIEHISDPAFVTPVSEYKNIFNSQIDQPALRKGDFILSADGFRINDYQELEDYLSKHNRENISLGIFRDGENKTITISPVFENGHYSYGIALLQRPVIGRSEDPSFISGDIILTADNAEIEWTYDLYTIKNKNIELRILRDGNIISLPLSLSGKLPFAWYSNLRKYSDSDTPIRSGFIKASDTYISTIKALNALITFHVDDARTIITGPMKAASTFSSISALAFTTSVSSGFRTVLMLLAFVSISISVGNLIPIPTFDGGGMLMSLIEMLKRKPLKPRTYVILQISGMIVAYAIIAFMYSLDIKDLFMGKKI